MNNHIMFEVVVNDENVKTTLAVFHFYNNEFNFSFELNTLVDINLFIAEFENQKFYINNIFNAGSFNSYLANLKESAHMKNYSVICTEV